MSKQRYDVIDAAEDASKVGYSVVVFAKKAFYQVSGIKTLRNSMDAYMLSRFSQRLEYFVHEHETLTYKEKKEFYDDLKNNKQNVNYLYEFVEKARTTTFDIHARIYAVISAKLIKNKTLSYFENDLLSNLHLFNEEDIIHLAFILRVIDEPKGYCDNEDGSFKIQVQVFKNERPTGCAYLLKHKKIEFLILKPAHYYTYQKCIQVGIIDESPMEQEGGLYGAVTNITEPTKKENRKIVVSENTIYFYLLLKELFLKDE